MAMAPRDGGREPSWDERGLLPAGDALRENPLLPRALAVCVSLLALAVPNLVFSGFSFHSSLHLMKWVAALVPLALGAFVAMGRVLRRGTTATGFRLDGFAVLWLILLLYVTVQPFWSGLRSPESFFRAWFVLAGLWWAYVLFAHVADRPLLRAVLWGALVSGAVNVLFAEMQVRGLSGSYSFILPTPGHYVGNTGQQNMLALWLAVSGLGGAFLMMCSEGSERRLLPFVVLLQSLTLWGMISTTSRSGILGYVIGFSVLAALLVRTGGRRYVKRGAAAALLFLAVLGANLALNQGRLGILTLKMGDMLTNPLSIAHRDTIWATSWRMYADAPLSGVGLGQYKWHYLDAQRAMRAAHPRMKWLFTHWAHNEYLQWFAEAGTPGGVLLMTLFGWWWLSLLAAFVRRIPLSPPAVWGSALVALFAFDALWTRPWHRVENALWLALAFAVTNREILLPFLPGTEERAFRRGGKVAAAAISLVAAAGLLYLADGVRGDRAVLLGIVASPDLPVSPHLERALRSPMVRDEAEREAAYRLISAGERRRDPQMTADGLNALAVYFAKEPHVRELYALREWSRKLDDGAWHEELMSYGSPDEAPASSGASRKSTAGENFQVQ